MTRVLGVISLVILLYLLLPIVVVVGSALGRTGYLAFPPHGLTLRWFTTALQDPRYIASFVTSLLVASCSTLLSLLLGLPAAYALARHEFPFRRLAETVLMLPLVLPALVLSIALTLSFSRIGFTAGTPRLILAHLVLCTPYVVRVALPVLQRLDVALVTLPAIRPGAIAAAVLAFIVSFDELDLAIFLADPRAPTLPVVIYSSVQLGIDPTIGAVSALLVLLATAGMALYQLGLLRRRVA